MAWSAPESSLNRRSGTATVPGPVATVMSMDVPRVDLRPGGRVLGQDGALGLGRRHDAGRLEGDPERLGLQPGGGRGHAHEVGHRDLLDRRPARTGHELEDDERDGEEQQEGDDPGAPHERARPFVLVDDGRRQRRRDRGATGVPSAPT